MSGDYTKEWYESHYQLETEYRAMACAIDWVFGGNVQREGHGTAIDIGCGVGLIVDELNEIGWIAKGYDLSWNARAVSEKVARKSGTECYVYWCDILVNEFLQNDLVICTEVAEHLLPMHARTLVAALDSASYEGSPIVFTAATPGQGGNGHVNEQPNQYWIDLFADVDRAISENETSILREALTEVCPNMAWMGKNVMVFR